MARTTPPLVGTALSQAASSNKSTAVSRKLRPSAPSSLLQLRSDLEALGVVFGPQITARSLKAGIITATELDIGAVGEDQLADGAVSQSKIANLAVGSAQIGNLAVGSAQIGNLVITGGKMANGAVGTTQVAADAITAIWTYSSSASASPGEYFNQAITRTANTELLLFVQIAPDAVTSSSYSSYFSYPHFYYKRGSTVISEGSQLRPIAQIGVSDKTWGPVIITSINIDTANVSGSQTYKFGAFQESDLVDELAITGYLIILMERKR